MKKGPKSNYNILYSWPQLFFSFWTWRYGVATRGSTRRLESLREVLKTLDHADRVVFTPQVGPKHANCNAREP